MAENQTAVEQQIIISCNSTNDADAIENALKKINANKNTVRTTDVNGVTTINVELSAEELQKLNDAILKQKIKTGGVKVAAFIGGAVTGIAEFLVKDLAIPCFKVGATVGMSAVRIATEAAVISAASATNVIKNEGSKAYANIGNNSECKEATATVKSAFNRITSFLGAGSDITISTK